MLELPSLALPTSHREVCLSLLSWRIQGISSLKSMSETPTISCHSTYPLCFIRYSCLLARTTYGSRDTSSAEMLLWLEIISQLFHTTKTLRAVPDNFGGMHIFAVVITIVALATYLVVFNLNRLTYGLISLYRRVHQPLIKRMSQDPGPDGVQTPWPHRGLCFQSWQPDQRDPSPSEWLVVWYGFV